jgi:hypothetical protein
MPGRNGDDEIDRMIENAKRMRRKPYQREPEVPDRPEPAAADATRTRGIAPYISKMQHIKEKQYPEFKKMPLTPLRRRS